MHRPSLLTLLIGCSILGGCIADGQAKGDKARLDLASSREGAPDDGSSSVTAGGLFFDDALSSVDPQLENGEYFDVREIYCGEDCVGQSTLSFEVASQDFDTFLMIGTPSHASLYHDDLSGIDTNSALYVTPEPGVYYVFVTSYSPGDTGDYDLSVTVGLASSQDRCRQAVAAESVRCSASGAGFEQLCYYEALSAFCSSGRPTFISGLMDCFAARDACTTIDEDSDADECVVSLIEREATQFEAELGALICNDPGREAACGTLDLPPASMVNLLAMSVEDVSTILECAQSGEALESCVLQSPIEPLLTCGG